jgi:hypothetical protein
MRTASPDPHIKALERQLREKGHLVVASQLEAELYRWTTRQRWLWQCGLLDRTIERGLHAIGFPFEVEDCEWEQAFAHVATLRRRSDRLPVPPLRSGQWLQHQRERELLQAGRLPRNREDRLRAEGAFDSQGPLRPRPSRPSGEGRKLDLARTSQEPS